MNFRTMTRQILKENIPKAFQSGADNSLTEDLEVITPNDPSKTQASLRRTKN